MFGLFRQLAGESSSWSKACAAVAVPICCDKLGDIKLKKPAGDALVSFAEKSSLGFVLSQGKPSEDSACATHCFLRADVPLVLDALS